MRPNSEQFWAMLPNSEQFWAQFLVCVRAKSLLSNNLQSVKLMIIVNTCWMLALMHRRLSSPITRLGFRLVPELICMCTRGEKKPYQLAFKAKRFPERFLRRDQVSGSHLVVWFISLSFCFFFSGCKRQDLWSTLRTAVFMRKHLNMEVFRKKRDDC